MPTKRMTKAGTKERQRKWKRDNAGHIQQYQRRRYRQSRIDGLRKKLAIVQASLTTVLTKEIKERIQLNLREIEVKLAQLEHDQKTDV